MSEANRTLDPEVVELARRNRAIIRAKREGAMTHSRFWTARVMIDDYQEMDNQGGRHAIREDPRTGNRR